jgi:hypothetical protein
MSEPIVVTFIDASERKVALVAASPTTKRYVIYSICVISERGVFQNYSYLRWSDRRVMIPNIQFATERTVFIPERILNLVTSRSCALMPPAPCLYERFCTYVPGIQVITKTTKVILPFKYVSDRSILIETDPISMRNITFTLEVPDERFAWMQCLGDSRISSLVVHLSVSRASDRFIYFELLDKVSQRQIQICLEVVDDRLVSLQIQRLLAIATPNTVMALARVFSDRQCMTGGEQAYSDRLCSLLLHPNTERLVSMVFTSWDERGIHFSILQSSSAFSFYAHMARPIPTERMVTYVPIVYQSERPVWIEIRELFQTRVSTLSEATNIIRATSDTNTLFSMKNDRNIEIGGLPTYTKESTSEKISVHVQSAPGEGGFSMVDNMGASITQDYENVKPVKHLVTAKVRLKLIKSPSSAQRTGVLSSYDVKNTERHISIRSG